MKWMSFADVRSKLARAIDASQEQDVVILVRGKPAAKLVGIKGQTIEQIVEQDQDVLHLLHERQREPGRSIALADVEARIRRRLPEGGPTPSRSASPRRRGARRASRRSG